MANRVHLVTIVATLLTATACGTERSSSLSPNGPSLPAPPRAITGTVTINSIAPANGATLVLFDCDPTLPMSNGTLHEIGACTNQLRLTIDLDVDRNLSDASLKVQLLDGSRVCGIGYGGARPTVSAGRTTWTIASPVVFSDHPELAPACALPLTTTRIRVELWEGNGPFPLRQLLTAEFEHTYRVQLP